MDPAWLDGELPARPGFDPAGYVADDALRRAVNAALALGMPLLLTGEPGVGKTQLAFRLAWELDRERATKPKKDIDQPLRFDTKSTSVAADLFYHFDSVRYFGDCQLAVARREEAPEARDYISYRALGQAVLDSREWDTVQHLLPKPRAESQPPEPRAARRSVVLIDEIDKAPRDFPNDLLSQLEGSYRFDIPELKAWGVEIAPLKRPIVVITSNSERQLPEAFLRRCVFHHIALPTEPAKREAWLRHVLSEHFGADTAADTLAQPSTQDAVQTFWALRDRGGLVKTPSTRELLDWLHVLRSSGIDLGRRLREQPAQALQGTLGVLLKTADDLQAGITLLASSPAAR